MALGSRERKNIMEGAGREGMGPNIKRLIRMKIAVYGAGGVGGYFGGRLAQAGAEVHFIARGAHLDALRTQGLQVRSTLGDFTLKPHATDNPLDIGPCDYVLFCVKAYDTERAAANLAALIKQDTAVVSLQNGVDNEHKIAEAIGHYHVMGGIAYILSTIAEPGVVEHTGGPARITFGEMNGVQSPRATKLLEAFQRAQVEAEISTDIRQELWSKFAFICAAAGMTTASRVPIGTLRTTDTSWKMFGRMIKEVIKVAVAEGVELPADVTEKHMLFAEQLEPNVFSSLHYDMTHDKPMELEALHGTVVRKAREHEVPVPMHAAVYALLKPWSDRLARH